jgi:hypothetical protein
MHKLGCSVPTLKAICLLKKKLAEHFVTTRLAVTLHAFSMTMLFCPDKHNRCKQIVSRFTVEVIDLLVVGWVIIWPREGKVMEGWRNPVIRLGIGFVVY